MLEALQLTKRYFANSASEIERKLIYEESPTQTIEALRLSD